LQTAACWRWPKAPGPRAPAWAACWPPVSKAQAGRRACWCRARRCAGRRALFAYRATGKDGLSAWR
jgi:hypothetical protein